jgi:hypothetical protein
MLTAPSTHYLGLSFCPLPFIFHSVTQDAPLTQSSTRSVHFRSIYRPHTLILSLQTLCHHSLLRDAAHLCVWGNDLVLHFTISAHFSIKSNILLLCSILHGPSKYNAPVCTFLIKGLVAQSPLGNTTSSPWYQILFVATITGRNP